MTGRPARVRVQGDEELTADLVVAADGIHSAARRELFPGLPEPRYAGYTAWRFVVPAPDRPYPAGETWGPGGAVGHRPAARRARLRLRDRGRASRRAGRRRRTGRAAAPLRRLARPHPRAPGHRRPGRGAPQRRVHRRRPAARLPPRAGRAARRRRAPHDPEPRAGRLPGHRGRRRAGPRGSRSQDDLGAALAAYTRRAAAAHHGRGAPVRAARPADHLAIPAGLRAARRR